MRMLMSGSRMPGMPKCVRRSSILSAQLFSSCELDSSPRSEPIRMRFGMPVAPAIKSRIFSHTSPGPDFPSPAREGGCRATSCRRWLCENSSTASLNSLQFGWSELRIISAFQAMPRFAICQKVSAPPPITFSRSMRAVENGPQPGLAKAIVRVGAFNDMEDARVMDTQPLARTGGGAVWSDVADSVQDRLARSARFAGPCPTA